MVVRVCDPQEIAVYGEPARFIELGGEAVAPPLFRAKQCRRLSGCRIHRLDLRVVRVGNEQRAGVVIDPERMLEPGVCSDAVEITELEEVRFTAGDKCRLAGWLCNGGASD